MAENLRTQSLADADITWGSFRLRGIAKDDSAVEIAFLSDGGEDSLSGDGEVYCLMTDNDNRVEVTIKLDCGAEEAYCELLESYLENKANNRPLFISNTRNGEAIAIDCAWIKRMPLRGYSFRNAGTLDVVMRGILVNVTKAQQIA